MRRLPMPARIFPSLVLLILLLASVVIGAARPAAVTDDTGFIYRPAAAPVRLISLTPSHTEILFALGLADRVAGVTNYCDYPAAAKTKEKIGDLNLDYEKILTLKPDLILAVSSMQAQAIEKLRGLGLTVLAFNPTDLASTMAVIRKIGAATGAVSPSRKVVNGMKKRLAAVGKRLSGLAEKDRPRVFVEIWMDPIMTAGPGTFTAELISLAGGRDIAHDATPWSAFSQELILTRDPQVIISQCESAAQIMKRPGWSGISALKSGQVHDVDQNIFSRPGPRLIEALEVLARLLHPEKFK